MKVKLIKHSVCPCGFPLLKTTIPLGQEYKIDPTHKKEVVLICGGCKRRQNLTAVWVEARGTSSAGYLPEQAFAPA